jgi:hypothetical protein
LAGNARWAAVAWSKSMVQTSRSALGRPLGVVAVVLATLFSVVAGLGPTGLPSASAVTLTPNWIGLSPATAPPARTAAAMAYDPATGDMVLFGGDQVTDGTGVLLSDTWTWDGSTWTEQFPSASPAARYGASLAYDAATGDLVLFGGVTSAGDASDTWTWNGTTWTPLLPKNSPPARYAASVADDQATGLVVLFGGLANHTMLSDTWTWDGTTWTQQHPGSKPPARYAASMGYDAATATVVLFGGYEGGLTGLSDTWTWNGSNWSQQAPASSPSGRYGASVAYDPAAGEMILFGGYSSGNNDQSDMWTWDGSTWTKLSPTTSPPARRYAVMDYDGATGNLVLFGGDPGGIDTPSSLSDTWIWGSQGSFVTAPTSPTIILGNTDTDTATVTGSPGAGVPTGTVTFYACGPTSTPTPCTSEPPFASPVTLNATTGDTATATSPIFTPTAPGYWCFAGAYSGDADYAGGLDTALNECVLVDSSIVTTPVQSSVALGNPNSDRATVFGTAAGGSPSGTVTFYACGPAVTPTACTSEGDPLGSPVTLNASTGDTATAMSPAFVPTATGDWCFGASYSGGGSYAPGTDTTTDECFVVNPIFLTAPSASTIALGTSNTDVAAVTGNAGDGMPTGTVTFYACGPTAVPTPCTSQADQLGHPVTLNASTGDTATALSIAFIPTAAGDWCFGASYSGDGSYPAGSDTTTAECFTVVAVAPTFTSAAAASAVPRKSFTFTVTTSGEPTATIVGTGLPRWLVLTDNHNGTATLSATKAHRGKHSFVLTATNSASSVRQTFTLTVRKPAV